jgi:hypothetical protein
MNKVCIQFLGKYELGAMKYDEMNGYLSSWASTLREAIMNKVYTSRASGNPIWRFWAKNG